MESRQAGVSGPPPRPRRGQRSPLGPALPRSPGHPAMSRVSSPASTSAPGPALHPVARAPPRRPPAHSRPVQAGASADDAAPDARQRVYNYTSTDGKPKATMEDAWRVREQTPGGTTSAPWNVGWQMNERNTIWSDDMKKRFILVRPAIALRG